MHRIFFQKLHHMYYSKSFLWFLIALGLLLQLSQYAFNRSLWVDEATVALQIIETPYVELLPIFSDSETPDYNKTTPPGLLIIERFFVQIFGESEYVLRLFPLCCGLLSILLFVKVIPYFIRPAAIPISLLLFVTSGALIYYSSSLKPYSGDVCIALLLYGFTIHVFSKPVTLSRILLFGALGGMAIWFSYTSVFVLAGIGSFLLVVWARERAWQKVRMFCLTCGLWGGSFFLFYLVMIRFVGGDSNLQIFWSQSGTFMPFPPRSVSDLLWFVKTFFETTGYALGLPMFKPFLDLLAHLWKILASVLGLSPSLGISLPQIGAYFVSDVALIVLHLLTAMMSVAGGIVILKKCPKRGILLLAPLFFTLLASGLHRYPFSTRVILFFIPILYMFLGEGTVWIRKKSKHTVSLAGLIIIGAVCLYPTWKAGYHFWVPRVHEEARPVLRYLKKHKQNDDVLYVYYASEHVYKYYSKHLGMEETKYIQGIKSRENWQKYLYDLKQLRGHKRVWLFFSHAYSEEAFFLFYLDSIGTKLDEFKDVRASVYLYNLD